MPKLKTEPSPVHKKAPLQPKSKSHFLEKNELAKNTGIVSRSHTSKNLLPRKSTIPEASIEEESNKSDSILLTSPRKKENLRPRKLTLHV